MDSGNVTVQCRIALRRSAIDAADWEAQLQFTVTQVILLSSLDVTLNSDTVTVVHLSVNVITGSIITVGTCRAPVSQRHHR